MLNHPIRLVGGALTLVVAALACVVMFVPIAAGSSPSGEDGLKRYASIKSGAPLKIVSRTDVFVISARTSETPKPSKSRKSIAWIWTKRRRLT